MRNTRGHLHEFSESTPAPKNHEGSSPAGGAPREPRAFFEKAHSFETPPGPLQWNVDSEEEPMKDTDPSPDEARAEFANVLIDLPLKGKISAKDLCTLAYYAKFAQIVGPMRDFAYKASAQSGHFRRQVTKTLGVEADFLQESCTLSVPGHDKYAVSRR